MDKGTIVIAILVVFGFIYLRTKLNQGRRISLVKKYGDAFGNAISDKTILIGMDSQMVRESKGLYAKSDGKTIRENYIKEVVYYDEYKDARQKSHYRLKVTFENDKVTEIKELN